MRLCYKHIYCYGVTGRRVKWKKNRYRLHGGNRRGSVSVRFLPRGNHFTNYFSVNCLRKVSPTRTKHTSIGPVTLIARGYIVYIIMDVFNYGHRLNFYNTAIPRWYIQTPKYYNNIYPVYTYTQTRGRTRVRKTMRVC